MPTRKIKSNIKKVIKMPNAIFLKALIKDPKNVGAICISSEKLANCMAAQVSLNKEGLVIELGAGTGVITKALLEHGVKRDRLIVIEQNNELANHLKERFVNVNIIEGDACDLYKWQQEGVIITSRVDSIVSGLPLLSIPQEIRDNIIKAAINVLPIGGTLIQFTYGMANTSPWEFAGLKRIHSHKILANIPPAKVEVFEKV